MLNAQCQCSLPPDHVFDNEFTCEESSGQDVIYRAKLKGVEVGDCDNLTVHLNNWVGAKSSITVQGNRLLLESSCDTAIDSLDVPSACHPDNPTTSTTSSTSAPSSESGLSLPIIAGAAGGGAVIILLLLILIIVVCCCIHHNRKKT